MRRRVLTTSFYVHALSLLVAVGPAVVIGQTLTDRTGRLGADVMSRADVVALIVTGLRADVRAALLALAIGAATQALLATPTQIAWLRALGGEGTRASLRAAVQRTLPALGTTALVLALLIPSLVATLALPVGAHLAGPGMAWAQSPAATALLSLPAIAVLATGALLHLLARVAIAEAGTSPREAIGRALRRVGRGVPRYALYLLASTALGALAVSLSVAGEGGIVASLAGLGAHALLFARTVLRGALYAALLDVSASG